MQYVLVLFVCTSVQPGALSPEYNTCKFEQTKYVYETKEKCEDIRQRSDFGPTVQRTECWEAAPT